MSDVKYAVWLNECLTPGSKFADNLLSSFENDYEAIYNASEEDYIRILGSEKNFSDESAKKNSAIASLCNKDLERAEKIVDYCERQNIGIMTLDSNLYPARLKRIKSKPILLYYKGRFPDFDNNACIACVGTRRMTDYGRRNAYTISYDLAKGGAIVVSGLARGVDSTCHRGALDAMGFTVAVLGCGIDVVYPPENEDLMNEIIMKGLVVTEYSPGSAPESFHFPMRNRIISGLSSGTFVVEADSKSGAMITARYAQSQGRDIFALPGKVGELNSKGTNSLIMDGARMITCGADILSEYEFIYPESVRIENILYQNGFSKGRSGFLKVASKPFFQKVDNKENKEYDSPISESFSDPKEKKSKKSKREDKKHTEVQTENVKEKAEAKPLPALSENEKLIYDMMPDGKGVTSDELTSADLPIGKVLTTLTTLELKGIVSALPGGLFMKK